MERLARFMFLPRRRTLPSIRMARPSHPPGARAALKLPPFRTAGCILLALVVGLVGAGCVHVAPYEREHLAKPSMDPAAEDQEAAFQAHVNEAREGASGGQGGAGGGCGCN